MKKDIDALKRVGQETNSISVFLLQQEKPYYYYKARMFYLDKLKYYDVPATNGKVQSEAFLPMEYFNELMIDRRCTSTKRVRKVRGRPFKFCKGCENEFTCTKDFVCKKRDEAIRKKSIKVNDERFYMNGVPKKKYILCQYSRYLWANHIEFGTCQKEKCKFFDNGKCLLSLYKD